MRHLLHRQALVAPDLTNAELALVKGSRGAVTIYILAPEGVTVLGRFDDVASAWCVLDALEHGQHG